jgi:polyisoprenyl-phosphate glycosyltransferase
MGTFILLGLGIIGEYLARIHEEVRGRPRYLVQDRTGPVPSTAAVPGQLTVTGGAPPARW